MSELAYNFFCEPNRQAACLAAWRSEDPPFSKEARLEAGFLLRRLQAGERLEMPYSRPMPGIGQRCHELRIVDANVTWRIVYRVDRDAVVIAEVFKKKSQTTPQSVIEISRKRLREYDNA